MKSNTRKRLITFSMFLMVVGGLNAQSRTQPSENLFDRLCRILGINPKLASILTGSRGGGDDLAPHGKRIVMASLDGKTSSVLWECGDCWSLALCRGDVTVIKKDGIWLRPRTGEAQRLVARQTAIAVQIGALTESSETMLAMTASGSGEASVYSFVAFNLVTGKAVPVRPDIAAQYRQPDVASFPRPDAIRGNRVLSTSKTHPLKLLIAAISNDPTPTLSLNKIILAPPLGVERFDPIWLDDNTIVYIERDL